MTTHENARAMLQTLRNIITQKRKISITKLAEDLGLKSDSGLFESFNKGTMTQNRLYEIYDITGITSQEVTDEMNKEHVVKLKIEHEEELLSKPDVLRTAVLLGNHWTMEQIAKKNLYFKDTVIEILDDLEKLKLIKRSGPTTVAEFKASPNFKWDEYGPMRQYVVKEVIPNYFKDDFDKEPSLFKLIPMTLSNEAFHKATIELENALAEVRRIIKEDARIRSPDERSTCTLVVALRNKDWDF